VLKYVECRIFYPDCGLSGGGDCSLEESGEGHDGGEESGELHVEMNSRSLNVPFLLDTCPFICRR
jgi:hypothetical protein